MHNNLPRPKKNLSVSALVGEENIAHELAVEFFFLSMCFSVNKTVFHFGSLARRPKRPHKLNAKVGTFSKLSYESCCDAVKYLFVSSF